MLKQKKQKKGNPKQFEDDGKQQTIGSYIGTQQHSYHAKSSDRVIEGPSSANIVKEHDGDEDDEIDDPLVGSGGNAIVAAAASTKKRKICSGCRVKRLVMKRLVTCNGKEPCQQCRKDKETCDYGIFSVDEVKFIKETKAADLRSLLGPEHILFGSLPAGTDFSGSTMSAWVAAEARRSIENMLTSVQALAMVFHSHVVRQKVPRGKYLASVLLSLALLTRTGRMRLYLGIKDNVFKGGSSSMLPIIYQASEWSSAEVSAYLSWKPETCLFATNATLPRRDDT